MAIKKKEEINFDLLIGLGNPPIRINGFDISRDKMPSEEFYSGKHGMCAGKFGQRDDSPDARMDDDAAWGGLKCCWRKNCFLAYEQATNRKRI